MQSYIFSTFTRWRETACGRGGLARAVASRQECSLIRFGLGLGLAYGLMAVVGLGAPGQRAAAQTLAHRGWAGSGMTVDTWWRNAVFYEVDPLSFQDSNGDGFGDLKGIADRLDYLQQLDVDALVLAPLAPKEQAAGTQGGVFDARYGTEEDFDHLEQEAARRRIRLVVEVPLNGPTTDEVTGKARFWLSRGVGGLRLTDGESGGGAAVLAPELREERLRAVRKVCAGFSGNRVVLVDRPAAGAVAVVAQAQPVAVAHARRRRRAPSHQAMRPAGATEGGEAQLAIDNGLLRAAEWKPELMRVTLAAGAGKTLLVSDGPGRRSADRFMPGLDAAARVGVAKMQAAVLLTGEDAPLLYFGQEVGAESADGKPVPMPWGGEPGFSSAAPWIEAGPNAATENVDAEEKDPQSLLSWYRKLNDLRHANGALRAGAVALVETGYPEVVAWVRRGTNPHEQPVLVVANDSPRPVVLSLVEPLKKLGLAASSGVKPLAYSFTGTDPSFTASGIALPAYGVYVGEVHQPGLEDAAQPVVHARSRRRGR